MTIAQGFNVKRASHQAVVCGFPPRHVNAIHSAEESDLTESQHAAFLSLCEFCVAGGITIVRGGYGCGKTHLASWLGINWNIRGYNRKHGKCRYWTVPQLLQSQKSWFSKKDRTDEPFDLAKECGLLILDELDTTNDTVFDQREIKQLLDWRYSQANKPTILMTNLTTDRIGDALDASILDRVMEGGGLIEMQGASMRGSTG